MEKKIVWDCPACGHGIESVGRDESSRMAVRAFKADHGCTAVKAA